MRIFFASLVGIALSVAPAYAFTDQELTAAIFHAEGGKLASIPYGVRFKGCDWGNPAFCRRVCLNTIQSKRLQFKRLQLSKKATNSSFLDYLASKYAPLSDSPLNRNWLKNVKWFLNNPREVSYVR